MYLVDYLRADEHLERRARLLRPVVDAGLPANNLDPYSEVTARRRHVQQRRVKSGHEPGFDGVVHCSPG